MSFFVLPLSVPHLPLSSTGAGGEQPAALCGHLAVPYLLEIRADAEERTGVCVCVRVEHLCQHGNWVCK